jgi:hypothetical protein
LVRRKTPVSVHVTHYSRAASGLSATTPKHPVEQRDFFGLVVDHPIRKTLSITTLVDVVGGVGATDERPTSPSEAPPVWGF